MNCNNDHLLDKNISLDKTSSILTDFTVDHSAILQIKKMIKADKSLEIPFLRIIVETGGCAGMKYHIILDDYIGENDKIFQHNDERILAIDEYSLEFLKGGTLIYEEDFDFSGFKIDNPNSNSSCSCGNSFSCSL